MNKYSEIPVFFSVDDAYAPYLAAAVNSAVKNSSTDRKYRAVILHQGLSADNMKKLSALSADNFKVDFVPMSDQLDTITDRVSNRLRFDIFTLTIYFRLFIPTMFPEYDKGIYIDSDTIVLSDIAELFDTDIGDNLIGACADKSVVDVEPLAVYMENAVGISRYDYVNSGVLLMNLKRLRELEFDMRFLALLNKYHFDSVAPDQDYINAMCSGSIYYLDETWDAMPNENNPPLESPKLVHYNLFSKPWCYDGIQYGDYYWEYVKGTGFEEEARAFKANYTDEKKKADEESLAILIDRAINIQNDEYTFRKAAEAGEKIKLC